MTRWETLEAFDTFDVFYSHAQKFRTGDKPKRLRVHIPGGFPLTDEDRAKIKALGIENF